MKIAVHILAYNVNRFINAVIENSLPHVDKIYIAYPEKPWNYVESSRQLSVNPTKISDIKLGFDSTKIEIIQGDWLTEEDMRNDCLQRSRDEGFDWFLIQDADEFYTDASWEQIKRILLNNKSDDHFKTTWYNFWKSSHYVLTYPDGSIKHTNASFAFRCSSDVRFVRKRWYSDSSKVIDCPCYHYGYVMSDQEMFEKISTWGHANELFNKNWFRYKWQNWNERSRFLHPTHPASWTKAIRFPLEQPDFAEQFSLPMDTSKIIPFENIMGDCLYNTGVHLLETKNAFKRNIKGILHK